MSAALVATLSMTAAACAAAVIDLRTRRIPNLLTGTLTVVALGAHAAGGLGELEDAFLVMLVVLLIGTLAFSRGWFGGGDVKLLSACGAAVGSHGIVRLLLCVAVAGALLALVESARRGRLRALIVSTAGVVGGAQPSLRLGVPYGVAIGAGAIAYTASVLTTTH